ncbi:hypothetical protein M0805_007620 [Coniferiporia weirii]|nr:hypothetical protein M0805_007620 [Coniferiporia weirii]
MPMLQNHEVWIESDGKRYEEYDISTTGKSMVTCYIASEVDKVFQIGWINYNVPIGVSNALHFYVDGIWLDGFVNSYTSGLRTKSSKGHWTDATSLMPYKFSYVSQTDDDIVHAPFKDIGTICVELYRIVIGEAVEFMRPDLPHNLGMPLSAGGMNSHGVGFGNVEKVRIPRLTIKTHPYGNEVEPFVTFKFIYRPRYILQALGIIKTSLLVDNKIFGAIASGSGSNNGRKRKRLFVEVKTEDEETNFPEGADEEERELLKQQLELARKLKNLRQRRKYSSAKVKLEMGVEENSSVSAHMTDLTLNDIVAMNMDYD